MPIYTFRCTACSQIGDTILPMDESDSTITCPFCSGDMKHIPTRFASHTTIGSHYNPSAGTYITSPSHHADILKAQSEAATLRTGIEHNYVPIDPRESKDMLGVTDEGLDATRRAHHDALARHDVAVTDPDRRHGSSPSEPTPSRTDSDVWL